MKDTTVNLSALDESQRQVVESDPHRPMLVIAGAGTGKTRVLVERIKRLVTVHGVGAGKILALTFTNEAGHQLQDRLKTNGVTGVWAGTFHKLCGEILRESGQPYELVTDSMRQMIVAMLLCRPDGACSGMEVGSDAVRHEARKEENLIGQIKNGLRRRGESRVYADYQAYLAEHGARDYDDLLLCTRRLLESEGGRWRSRWSHIFVDEFQDTNKVQYAILKLLETRSILAVGDFSQSIYAFRGAHPENIGEFVRDFQPSVLPLQVNHRCARRIHELSLLVIRGNNDYVAQDVQAAEGAPEGEILARTGEREIESVVSRIARTGGGTEETAVLYRSRPRLLDNLKRRLAEAKLPFACMDDISGIIGCFMGLLQFLRDPDNDMLYRLAVYTIGDWKNDVEMHEQAGEMTAGLFRKALASADPGNEVVAMFSRLGGLNGSARARILGLLGYLWENEGRILSRCTAPEIWEALPAAFEPEIVEAGDDWKKYIADFGISAGVRDLSRRVLLSMKGCVRLMTIHSAKGLEFERIFFINSDLRSWRSDRKLERQRLAYVAVTRAKRCLVLTSSGGAPLGGTSVQIRKR